MRLPSFLGTDDPSKYSITDDYGNAVEIPECVVPIIYVDKAEPRTWRFVGTAFFIAQDLIVTARHVLDDIFENDRQLHDPYILHYTGNDKFTFRPLISCSPSLDADIAIGQVLPIPGRTNSRLPLRHEDPVTGDTAFTYAFPNSSVIQRVDSGHDIVMEPAFYRGVVVAMLPNGRDRVMLPWPCVHVNFFMHPGSSGGPVFDKDGRVFGVNCMSGEPDRNVAYATAIGMLRGTALRNVIVEGEFYELCPFDRLLETGVVELH